MIEPPVTATLARLADLMAGAHHPWWVIGSAAIALHGVPGVGVRDVDVVVDRDDLRAIAEAACARCRPGSPSDRFRSRCLLTVDDAPLPIELFADFAVHRAGCWQAVVPRTREPILIGASALFVPAVAELAAMLDLFDRPKDRARVAMLRGPQPRR